MTDDENKELVRIAKVMKVWIWFQKQALTVIIFIAVGILIGISCSKIFFEKEVTRAINLQRFEFKGDLFEVHPSSIQKYYNKENVLNVIPIPNSIAPTVQPSSKK